MVNAPCLPLKQVNDGYNYNKTETLKGKLKKE
jgi:hypothetical protein